MTIIISSLSTYFSLVLYDGLVPTGETLNKYNYVYEIYESDGFRCILDETKNGICLNK